MVPRIQGKSRLFSSQYHIAQTIPSKKINDKAFAQKLPALLLGLIYLALLLPSGLLNLDRKDAQLFIPVCDFIVVLRYTSQQEAEMRTEGRSVALGEENYF